MIQKHDLRIGNLINVNGIVAEVDHIKCPDYSTTTKDGFVIVFKKVKTKYTTKQDIIKGYTYETDEDDSITPIPLTPEILEKAGFEKLETPNKYGWYIGIGKRELCWCYADFISLEFVSSEYNDTLFDFPCKFAHQLQNLYYTLTGEELKIEL